MKKLPYIILVLLLTAFMWLVATVCVRAQISDLTFSKPYFENTLQIINRNITDLECIEEYGYNLGNNELLVFGLSTFNMGQHDAAFEPVADSLGNILPDSILHEMGLHWDGCHWHVHTDSLYIVVVRDVCYNIVAVGAKIGFNFQDGGNVITWILSPNGSADHNYLLQFGAPDYSLQFHPPNDNFNGDTRMGLSAGYYDTYNPSTWGNSVPSHTLQGDYFICVYANYDKYFNQGLNIFPDSSISEITITPQRTVILNSHTTFCQPLCTDSIPETISATVTNGFWGTREIIITDACVYPVTRHLVNGNKIQNSGVALNVSGGTFIDTDAPSGEFFVYRQGGKTSNKVKFR